MTYTMEDQGEMARRATAGNDPLSGHFYDALLNLLIEQEKQRHPTYHRTVQAIAERQQQKESRGFLTGLVRDIFGCPAQEREDRDALRDAEYDALKQIGQQAGLQLQDMLLAARRHQGVGRQSNCNSRHRSATGVR